MQPILEALARWHPPDGTLRSVTVEVDRETLAPTAMITIARSRDTTVSFVLELGYAESLNLSMPAIANRLTTLAQTAYAAQALAANAPKPATNLKAEKGSGRPAA